MTTPQTLEVPIAGMDCAECTQHVRQAIAALPGVSTVEVSLAGEKAWVQGDLRQVTLPAIRQAVAAAGYQVPETAPSPAPSAPARSRAPSAVVLLGGVFGSILFIVVIGEWLGLFALLTRLVPWPIGAVIVGLAGFPVFRNVVRATLHRQIIAHTLMSLGVIAALAVGQWVTAAVVVFFMRVSDYVEQATTERARHALRDLTALAPRQARVERDGGEHDVPVAQVRPDEIVVVRPGEQIPVDGEVVSGQAVIDQATITGESVPVEAGPGVRVFAATIPEGGSLRIRTTHIGPDTTFGRVIRLVEAAETQRAGVQRLADRFAAYYLPVVAGIALLTFLIRRDPLATAAVLVVACACSFALATPVAVLAAVGGAARRGLLIKGGKYLEALAQADVLLVDKTGTLTLGRPQITDIVPLNGQTEAELLALAAGAERYSEHPLAAAVRDAAGARGLALPAVTEFAAVPGQGVRAQIAGHLVQVGSARLLGAGTILPPAATALEAVGKTLLYVLVDGTPAAVLAAADTPRAEIATALAALRALGVRDMELLTGDNEQTAAALAAPLGLRYRANLLPQDKVAVVRAYQAQGRRVVMVGDGVNDAPALAQADVGLAMGAGGSALAAEAAHVILLRDDWMLVPEAFALARRTLGVIRLNLAFTILYNIVGLTLAALGLLPPVLAAAAQSLPDLGIMANSARLLRQNESPPKE